MKTRIIKEAKALLPAFALTVGLTLVTSLLWRGESALAGCVILFSIGCTLMGANCFGHEFSGQTMGLLLSQPISRRRIWHEKMLVLGVALALTFAVLLACVWFLMDQDSVRDFIFTGEEFYLGRSTSVIIVKIICYFFVLGAIPLAVFCSTPRWTLATRNTFMGFLATWTVPFCILLIVAAAWAVCERVFGWDLDLTIRTTRNVNLARILILIVPVAVVFGTMIYCALTYRFGYAALMKFQSAAVRQREIVLPDRWQNALARPFAKLLPRYSSPMTSLLRKEILLQRPAYVVALGMCLMALIAAIADKIHDSDGIRSLLVIPLVVCVVILPLVATGLSVAEERNLGMAAWHRTLPPSLRRQWLVKLAVVLETCVLLGVILPWLMAAAGQALGLFPDAQEMNHKPILLMPFSIPLTGCLVYIVLLAIGIFASSLSTTTFRAILLTLALVVGIAALIVLPDHFLPVFQPNLRGGSPAHELPFFISVNSALAVFLFMLSRQAYVNYRTTEPSPYRVWIDLGIILGVMASLLIAVLIILLCRILF